MKLYQKLRVLNDGDAYNMKSIKLSAQQALEYVNKLTGRNHYFSVDGLLFFTDGKLDEKSTIASQEVFDKMFLEIIDTEYSELLNTANYDLRL